MIRIAFVLPGELPVDIRGVVLETVSLVYRNRDRLAVHETDKIRITGIMRVGQDHLIPRFQQDPEKAQHEGVRPGADDDLIRLDRDFVLAAVIPQTASLSSIMPRLWV